MSRMDPSKWSRVAALLSVLGVVAWAAWSPAPRTAGPDTPGPAARAAGPPATADTVVRDTTMGDTARADTTRGDTTRANIVNETDFTMRIDLLPSSGARRYLGTIAGFDSASYVLADYQMGPTRTIRFLAHPIGGPADVPSGEIYVGPGETVEWRIRPPLPFRGRR